MIITRDNDRDGMICFWAHGTLVEKTEGFWVHNDWPVGFRCVLLVELSSEEFKLEYPTKRLPRKGSKLSVPKRDYLVAGSILYDMVRK
jgi:hypothetical protein